MKMPVRSLLWGVPLLLLSPTAAFAYIGPGAGLGAFAMFLSLGAALLLLVAGFVWYPVKRLLRARRERVEAERSHSD